MKNTLIKILIAVLVVSASSQLFTQDIKGLRKELKDQINNYKTINIIPQLKEWKSDIDKNIKSDDLVKLNELREKAYNLRSSMKKKMDEYRSKDGKQDFDKKQKNKNRSANKENIKEIGKELKTIIGNNEEYFDKLFVDAKPILENWKEDIDEIVEKWYDENEELIEEVKENHKGKFKPKHDRMDFPSKRMAAARILLYNGKDDFDSELQQNSLGATDNETKSANFPNPFKEQTNIKFSLPEASVVKISIIDEYGKIIEEVQNSYLSKGDHTISFVPKTNLKNGLYFYRIESEKFKESGKLIYQK